MRDSNVEATSPAPSSPKSWRISSVVSPSIVCRSGSLGPPHPPAPLPQRGKGRVGSDLLPVPLWGRGWRGAPGEGVDDKPHSRRNKGRWKGTALSVPKNVPPKPLPSPLGRGCPGGPSHQTGRCVNNETFHRNVSTLAPEGRKTLAQGASPGIRGSIPRQREALLP